MVYFFTVTAPRPSSGGAGAGLTIDGSSESSSASASLQSPCSSSSRTTTNTSYIVYMGKNQGENELLIKYGHPEDVWFHVDDLSSAHVYLRMKPGMTLDDIPQELILDCSCLVKANSIAGCKVCTANSVLNDCHFGCLRCQYSCRRISKRN